MNKKLYVRFFNLKEDEIPTDSDPLDKFFNLLNIIEIWMKDHPDGKIDIVLI